MGPRPPARTIVMLLACVGGLASCLLPSFGGFSTHYGEDGGPAVGEAGAPSNDASAGPDGGLSCSARSAIFCEDFENGLGNRWRTRNEQGTTEIVTTRAHWGTASLLTHIDELTSPASTVTATLQYYGQIQSHVPLPAHGFLRVFVFVPSSPSPASYGNMLSFQQDQSPYPGWNLGLKDGAFDISDWANSPLFERTASAPFPKDEWVCIEHEWTSGAAGALSAKLDGQPLQDVGTTGPVTVPPMDIMSIGLTFAPGKPQPPIDMWMDDLLVDTQPIGCDR